MIENRFTRAERLAKVLRIIPATIKVGGRRYTFTLNGDKHTAYYLRRDSMLVSVTADTSYEACKQLIDSYLEPNGLLLHDEGQGDRIQLSGSHHERT